MTAEIVTVFTILGISVVFLVTEWIPMEVTALLTLGATINRPTAIRTKQPRLMRAARGQR